MKFIPFWKRKKNRGKFGLHDTDRVHDWLEHSVADPAVKEEFRRYLQGAFPRFMITMEYLPEQPGRVLEIGSTPYYITLLMKRFRSYDLELSNFFGQDTTNSSIVYEAIIDNPDYSEYHRLPYRQFNVERQVFPYADEMFEGVVFCEVLEHLTADPMAALAEMHRVLKPGGWLLVTTPNAVRYENIVKMHAGQSIYAAYSAHGPYGRHNREYTIPELRDLLNSMGFEVTRIEARNLWPDRPEDPYITSIKPQKPPLEYDDGLFCLATKNRPLNFVRPEWLYELGDQMPLPAHLRDRLEKPKA